MNNTIRSIKELKGEIIQIVCDLEYAEFDLIQSQRYYVDTFEKKEYLEKELLELEEQQYKTIPYSQAA